MEEVLRELEKINKRLDFIEFRQDLLYSDTSVNRILYDYKVTNKQYNDIMNEMDRLRSKLDSGNEIHHGEFENKIYNIMDNRHDIDYHFCEYIAKAFMDDDRWEEVFPALYGDMPKYKYLKEDRNDK